MERRVKTSVIELRQGDITQQHVDAIVNAANTRLAGGGGVDGAIHRAGGPVIMQECRAIGGCPTGDAVITSGGNLPARYVIHAVGPVYRNGASGEAQLLAQAYRNSLKRADEHKLKTVAFPSISTGTYGYPIKQAARIALGTVIDYLNGSTSIERVVFVLFSAHDLSVYEDALKALLPDKK
ncbi:MAG: O-acetyl-ADP-ribose deacetylase [Desulfobacterota bacterium]|nr:O-acetyl-ADP-ribose deacetylase [Thermodesulfobacteriota bacterium]